MSLEAITWVLNDAPGLPSHCVGVMIGLANHARPDGTGAWAAQGLLSKYARKNARQVRRDLDQLETIGLIRRGNQRFVNHLPADKRPIVWDLAMDRRINGHVIDETDPEGVAEPVDNPERQDAHDRPDVHDRSPTTGRRRPAGRTRPVADVPPDADDRSCTAERPDVHVLQTVLEPTTTTKPCAPADADARQRDAKPERKPNPLARFDDFWKIYPKKKGKPAAQKAFAKAVTGGADPQAIIDGALAYVLECRMKDPQYIKYAQGWINDGRYLDEPDRPASAPAPREIAKCAIHSLEQPCRACAADAKADPDADWWTNEPPF